MDITKWSTPKSDWLYSLQPKMEKVYTVSKNKTGSWLVQIMNSLLPNRFKLKKAGKTTRPFRYDLNQISYDYTVEVRNRYKGLDLIQSAWGTMDRGLWHCTGDMNTIPKKKKCKKAKWLPEEALQIAVKRREARSKGKTYPFECRVPKNSKER